VTANEKDSVSMQITFCKDALSVLCNCLLEASEDKTTLPECWRAQLDRYAGLCMLVEQELERLIS